MKPTQIECSKGSFNQIPSETTVHGDIRLGPFECSGRAHGNVDLPSRLSPFYEVEDVVEHIERYVQDMSRSRRR